MSQLTVPGARLMLLWEGDGLHGDDQPSIQPTQVIWHTAIDGLGTTTLYNYWNSVNLETHGYVDRWGDLQQYMLLNVRADGNNKANRRWDGTGALSFETWDGAASFGEVRPWNDRQLATIIETTRWLCREFNIPAELPSHHAAPGVGYHNLHPEWSVGGTSCPSIGRRDQLVNIVIPEVRNKPVPTPKPVYGGGKMDQFTNANNLQEWLSLHSDGQIYNKWENAGQIELSGWNKTVDGVFQSLSDHVDMPDGSVWFSAVGHPAYGSVHFTIIQKPTGFGGLTWSLHQTDQLRRYFATL